MTSDTDAAEYRGSAPSSVRGLWLVLAMLALALLAALTAIFYQHQTTREATAYWGVLQAVVIRDAPEVTFCRLRRTDARGDAPGTGNIPEEGAAVIERETVPQETVQSGPMQITGAGGERWQVSDRRSIVHLAGLTHLRHALLQDESYRDGEPTELLPLDAPYALIFEGDGRRVVILLDLDGAWVRDATQTQWRSLAPIAPFLQRLLAPLRAESTPVPPAQSGQDLPSVVSGKRGTGK
jgi:hypothetical protein